MLVSEESYTTFNPMLAEVVGASVFPEHVVAPIRQMLDASKGSQFIMGRVGEVDIARRSITLMTLAGIRQIGPHAGQGRCVADEVLLDGLPLFWWSRVGRRF